MRAGAEWSGVAAARSAASPACRVAVTPPAVLMALLARRWRRIA